MRKLILLILSIYFIGCASTSNFVEEDVKILSNNKTNSSIHYTREVTEITVEKESNGKMIAFYTMGLPLEIVGCTLREVGRVSWYAAANVFMGGVTFLKEDKDSNELNDCVYLPNIEKDKKELEELEAEYKNSEIYKNRKYVSKFAYNTITKNQYKENVYWNDKRKKFHSKTETTKAEQSISDTAKIVSKRASLIGSYIGKGVSYVVGFPAFCIGFFIGSFL